MNPLTEWQSFYEMVGSAAGALTGLQFVVMALISDLPTRDHEAEQQAGEAFAGPTVVHFTAALLLAGSLAMPWHGFAHVRWCWLAGGVAGCVYTAVVLRRMVRQRSYEPVVEDWAFHVAAPLTAYAGMAASAVAIANHTRGTLFALGGIALLLIADGIHNAWDNVTYLVALRRKRLQASDPAAAPE